MPRKPKEDYYINNSSAWETSEKRLLLKNHEFYDKTTFIKDKLGASNSPISETNH